MVIVINEMYRMMMMMMMMTKMMRRRRMRMIMKMKLVITWPILQLQPSDFAW